MRLLGSFFAKNSLSSSFIFICLPGKKIGFKRNEQGSPDLDPIRATLHFYGAHRQAVHTSNRVDDKFDHLGKMKKKKNQQLLLT